MTIVVYFFRPPHRAPASRPHTLDPFREVKEYLIEAEDYSHHLQAKCAVRIFLKFQILPMNFFLCKWFQTWSISCSQLLKVFCLFMNFVSIMTAVFSFYHCGILQRWAWTWMVLSYRMKTALTKYFITLYYHYYYSGTCLIQHTGEPEKN